MVNAEVKVICYKDGMVEQELYLDNIIFAGTAEGGTRLQSGLFGEASARQLVKNWLQVTEQLIDNLRQAGQEKEVLLLGLGLGAMMMKIKEEAAKQTPPDPKDFFKDLFER